MLPNLDDDSLAFLESFSAKGHHRELQRGEVLIRQGDPSDDLYFVLSGRFSVCVSDFAEPVAEIGRGQPIGEIGFFADLPRTATVVALRDSRVLQITRDRFRELSELTPQIGDAVIGSLACRLSGLVNAGARTSSQGRVIAIIPAGGSASSADFVKMLRKTFALSGTALFLTENEVVSLRAAAKTTAPVTPDWFNALEPSYDFIFYISDQYPNEWTKRCVHQSDAILLVGTAGSRVELNEAEKFAFSLHPPTSRRLVVVHRTRENVVSGTDRWLGLRDVLLHHHVSLQDEADVTRLGRFLSGRAVGFVAGGGGALGSAHLGAYKAFREAGAEFDILGGTSVGAAMTAALAYGVEPERVDQGTHNIFVTNRAFRRPTIPRYGLINHKSFDWSLKQEYGDVLIENLWKPFFAVSSNLKTRTPFVHRRGPVWEAVRASSSLPGLLPPFFTKDGDMLVDGALMDNVPIEPMKLLKTGPNVVVTLADDAPIDFKVDYDAIPGPLALLATLLNPFSLKRLPAAPSILQVIMLSMLANRRQDPHLGPADVVVKPKLPEDLGFSNWERHSETFRNTYAEILDWIRNQRSENEANVLEEILCGRGKV